MGAESWMVTGGAGYIGSHLVRTLIDAGMKPVIVDDLSTGLVTRVPANVAFYQMDIADQQQLQAIMIRHGIHGVYHLAAKKSIEESNRRPTFYWDQNVSRLLALLEAMQAAGVQKIVFSSSSAVYAATEDTVSEQSRLQPESVYGQTKLACEQVVAKVAAVTSMRWISLRYFNVAGASEPHLIDSKSANLLPQVMERLLTGESPTIFGGNWRTPDGTCVRDFVHVSDVADAHVAAAHALSDGRCGIYNVGTGVGTSVAEVVRWARSITGATADAMTAPPRDGDIPTMVGDVRKIRREIGWQAQRDVVAMIEDEFRNRSYRNDGGQ